MQKHFRNSGTIVLLTLLASCSKSSNDVQKVIDKYCDLNSIEHNASSDADRAAAEAEKKAFEKEVDDKYFKDYKAYSQMLEGMKKCNEMFPETQSLSSGNNTNAELTSVSDDVISVANHYCALIDKTIDLAQNGSDSELKEAMAARVMFEHNMEESFKDNPQRRDSIFELIKPCMQREIEFKAKH
ncbi:MAG: hypothetical protein WBF83_09450 [Moheibacter sp.]